MLEQREEQLYELAKAQLGIHGKVISFASAEGRLAAISAVDSQEVGGALLAQASDHSLQAIPTGPVATLPPKQD